MKTTTSLLSLFIATSFASSQTVKEQRKELSEIVTGLKPPLEIVNGFSSPIAYLKTLSVQNTDAKLDSRQRYELAREMIRIHHLTQAFSDQSYFISPSRFPILKLLERNFPQFNQLLSEAGYNTSDIAEYFQKHPELWSP